MNQMTAYQMPRMPAPMGRDLSNTIAKYKNRLEERPGSHRHFSICESQAPSGAERQALQARRNELMNALSPGHPDNLRKEIDFLKAGFSNGAIDQATAAVQTTAYVMALENFPEWAVSEACARFRGGRNETPWRPSFCPTSAEVAAECRKIISSVQDELIPLADVLDAEIVPEANPDMAKRLSAVMQWEQDIRPAMKQPDWTPPKETPAQALDRLRAKATEPVVVGGELGKFLEGMKGATA